MNAHSSVEIEHGDGWVLRGKSWIKNPNQSRLPIFQCVRCGWVWADTVEMPACEAAS